MPTLNETDLSMIFTSHLRNVNMFFLKKPINFLKSTSKMILKQLKCWTL